MCKNIANTSLVHKDNTCAIVTIYLPGTEILHHIEKIKHQVHHIIVIINQCDKNEFKALAHMLSGSGPHNIIENTYNMGLAHALNQGIGIASSENMEWVLLLDQDTDVDDDIISELSKTISNMPILPAIIGSNYRDFHSVSTAFRCKNNKNMYQKKPTVITSGTLLNLEHAKHIGPFKSEYFIDSIDHEYCMRAKSLGYDIYITCKPLMTHNIGLQDQKFLTRLQCLLSHPHSPERKYYVARNTVATAKYYIYEFPLWSIRQFMRILAELFSTILFEDHKLQRITFTLRGILDGLSSNFKPGPLETKHVET
jgi:rhamnosyltransferase